MGALPTRYAGLAALTNALISLPARLRMLSLIAAEDEVCSCALEEPLGKSQPTISHHTRILSEAGLITGEKRGPWVWWQVVPERLRGVAQLLFHLRARSVSVGSARLSS